MENDTIIETDTITIGITEGAQRFLIAKLCPEDEVRLEKIESDICDIKEMLSELLRKA